MVESAPGLRAHTTVNGLPLGERGARMLDLARTLFPICRSITGAGLRESLRLVSASLPASLQLKLYEVPSGTPVLDWTVPPEWVIRDAYIAQSDGRRVVDFKQHNLHVVGYSTPINKRMTFAELEPHLYSLPNQPDAIPYVTSYYRERWGFCLSHRVLSTMNRDEMYHVVVDSELRSGALTYGELLIPGKEQAEIFISTYLCHPSMANNELSGPVVAAELIRWVAEQPRRFSYRFVFVPETIGSIAYLAKNHGYLKQHVKAGFNLSCLGDERGYSWVQSPYENTLADRVARTVGHQLDAPCTAYSFLERGSDERQYCSPKVQLPLVTLCRSKFNTYPEYHTSLDNFDVVTAAGLAGGFDFVRRCVETVEMNAVVESTVMGEPQLGRRGLYPTVSFRGSADGVKSMMDLLAYADGSSDLIDISARLKVPVPLLHELAQELVRVGLVVARSV